MKKYGHLNESHNYEKFSYTDKIFLKIYTRIKIRAIVSRKNLNRQIIHKN